MKSFKEFLEEGNELSRHYTFEQQRRHFVAMSAERKEYSPEENKSRMESLKEKVRKLGYGFRETEGVYRGGKENSITVYAKSRRPSEGKRLRNDMIRLASRFEQESILYHNGKFGTLIGTSDNSDFLDKNEQKRVGRLHFNTENDWGITRFNPQRSKDDENALQQPQPSYTMLHRKRLKNRHGRKHMK